MTAAATAAPADAPGNRPFWGALRLFIGNTRWQLGVLMLLMLEGQLVFMSLLMPPRHPGAHLAPASIYLVALAVATASLERFGISRLAFLRLLPFARAGRWLVLAPMCALSIPAVIPLAMVKHLPILAAVTMVGCCWWAVAFGRWWVRRFLYDLLVLPALVVAPGASYFAFRWGGWGAAAGVAMALALLGLALSPELNLAPARTYRLSRRRTRADRRPAEPTERLGEGRPSWLATAVGAVLVGDWSPPLRALVFLLGIFTLFLCSRDFRVIDSLVYAWMAFKLGELTKQPTLEFFCLRPVSRSQLVVGSLVPKLAFLLLLPLAAMVGTNIDAVNGHGLGWHHGVRPDARDIDFVRHTIGAGFLPEKWPASGLDLAFWPRLRPLIWLHIIKMSLFIDAMAFWMSLVDLSRDRKSPHSRLLAVPALASLILGFSTAFGLPHSIPAPPLWLAAMLAVTGAAVWWRSKPFELIGQRVPAGISR